MKAQDPKGKPWPVAEKQLKLIMAYAARITWKIPHGFDAWLSVHGFSSVNTFPDWHTAQRIVESLRAMCRHEHKCATCLTPCERERHA